MPKSLRSRLILLVALLICAAVSSGTVMVVLFWQSAGAKTNEAEALVQRACGAITDEYRFYTSGGTGLKGQPGKRAMDDVIAMALRDRPEIEGGIWSGSGGSLAYAYPSYQGQESTLNFQAVDEANVVAVNSIIVPSTQFRVAQQIPSGSDANAVFPWPENDLYGTQLGLNKNGKNW
jgi:hypothetical protein